MRINVVMGGPSAEYDISILTGQEIVRHLLGGPHRVRAVVITAKREMYATDIASDLPTQAELASPELSKRFTGPTPAWSSSSIWGDCDVALLGLHGSFGEDGRFQGFLETLGVPYTGSGVFASSVAMNKVATKIMMQQDGILTPPYSLCGRRYPQMTIDTLVNRHGFPCFVKCPQSGSSRLMGRADSVESLRGLLDELSGESDVILVETAIAGAEYSCPVIEYPDGRVKALPPVEIRPVKRPYFDYTAKYTDGASEEIVPAPRPPEVIEQIQQIALRVHVLLGCSGITRTDVIHGDGGFYTLEINTLPGLTPASLVPKSFAAAGGTYEQLLDILIRGAVALKKPG